VEGLAKVVPDAQFGLNGCGLPVRVDKKWSIEGGFVQRFSFFCLSQFCCATVAKVMTAES